jgi:addiction module HigA family antidote
MDQQYLSPISPGEMLLEEFLRPMGVSQNALARTMRVPVDRINAIVHGKRSVTVDTALRLSVALGTTPEFWLSLQVKFDLEMAKEQMEAQIKREVISLLMPNQESNQHLRVLKNN